MTKYIDVCQPTEDVLAYRLEVGKDIPAETVEQGEAAIVEWFTENGISDNLEPKVYCGDSNKSLWVDFDPYGIAVPK